MQHDRDAVERDAAARFGLDAPRNLDALLHLARCRKDHHLSSSARSGGAVSANRNSCKRASERRVGQSTRLRFVQRVAASRCPTRLAVKSKRTFVARRDRREQPRRARGKRCDEIALAQVLDRHVEQQRRDSGEGRRCIFAESGNRMIDHARAIQQIRRGRFAIELTQDRGERRTGRIEALEFARAEPVEAQIFARRRDRLGKSGMIHHAVEIRDLAAEPEAECRARGDRDRAKLRQGRDSSAAIRSLASMKIRRLSVMRWIPKTAPRCIRDRADEVICRRRIVGDHQRLGLRADRVEEFARGTNPIDRSGGAYDRFGLTEWHRMTAPLQSYRLSRKVLLQEATLPCVHNPGRRAPDACARRLETPPGNVTPRGIPDRPRARFPPLRSPRTLPPSPYETARRPG